VWQALAGLIALLLLAVIGLDQWQARHGESSLFGVSWPASSGALPAVSLEPRRPRAQRISLSDGPPGGARVAVIVNQVGTRRDVLEALRDLARPVTVALAPGSTSTAIAREATRSGLEVLLNLPMEPYGYPRLDPGPGTLLMSMPQEEIRRGVARQLDSLPGVVGVTNYMGSKLTEDRAHMHTVLEVLAARHLFLVDAFTSNLSIAYDEARVVGVRAARRQLLIDATRGESGERAGWDEVAGWAERRGEAIVLALAEPMTARLLREYIARWEARGLRVVPVSELVR
jgi:polysaccharide deacetylase 2 family uncharacterized protein YibQ